MNVYCYYHDPESPDFPVELVKMWRDSFASHGFNPVMLSLENASRHPRFNDVNALVKSFPTINSADYEYACWIRWLAYELVPAGLFTDYDVFNFNLNRSDVIASDMRALSRHCGTGSFYATPQGVGDFISTFDRARRSIRKLDKGDHVSDMYLFQDTYPFSGVEQCKRAHEGGAEKSPLVHFCNDSVPPEFQGNERWKFIKQFAERVVT